MYLIDGCDTTYGNICYTYHDSTETWPNAFDACIELGAYLADIEDSIENDIVQSIILGSTVLVSL